MIIHTNWYVIAGGPSSGKTKLIERLASLGYVTVPEISRLLIDAEISKGKTIKEVRVDEAEFQKKVFQMRIETEDKIPSEQITFFDGGGIPSCIAYYQSCGLDPTPVIEEAKKRKYKEVFLLEQLPFEKDYARTESEKLAGDLSRLIKKAYTDLGYDVIFVSAMSIEERVKFILNKLNL